MGGSSAPDGVSPSQYIPLVDAQADINRVNTIGPYGSSFFVDNAALNNGSQPSINTGGLTTGGASAIGRDVSIPSNTSPGGTPTKFTFGGGRSSDYGFEPATGPGSFLENKYLDIYDLTNDIKQDRFDGANPNLAGLDPGGVTQVNQFSPELQGLFDQQVGMAGGSPFGEGESANQALLARALNPEQTNQAVTDATFASAMDLLNPEFDKQSRAFDQKLANQGIQSGNEAYSGAYSDMSGAQDRARQNAAYQAVTSGQQAALAERGQNINELSQASNQGLQGNSLQSQLIAKLLGGNQPGGISSIDTTGPANMAMNQNMAEASNANANKNSQTNAGVGILSAAMMSDRRTKENITPAGKRNGFKVYLFNFKKWAVDKLGAPEGLQFGSMADEVKQITPEAVITGPDGYDRVNYGMIL